MAKRRIAPYRIGQIVGTILLNAYIFSYIQGKIIYSGFLKRIPEPVLNCYGGPLSVFACPLGSTQQIIGQQGIDWLHRIPWLALGVFVVVGAFVGRAACAWVCPFGLWQDLLYKVRTVFRKAAPAGERRLAAQRRTGWISFGIIAAIAALITVFLVLFMRIVWWKAALFGWLPFVALILAVTLRGKQELPSRLWVGSWLVGVGMGLLTIASFDVGYGIVTGVVAMVLLGLLGRWRALSIALTVVFLVGILGRPLQLGPFGGAELTLLLVLAAALVIIVLDIVARLTVPSTLLKFAFLFLVAGVAAYKTAEPWFCKLCPQGTLEAGIPLVVWDPLQALRQLVGWLYYVKIAFLLLVVIAAIAIKRPFCRLVCPIGAIYSLFNKGSLLHMKLGSSVCTACGRCRKVCPMDIDPQQGPNQLECIRCFECVWNCPMKALKIRL
uniref:4Fe-4S binding protein n=1 Tax=candidate division WOR-3 bacterium TaxID=2052148 RepID=A0A7C4CA27_UNCW3